jgi:PAS domain S-box-containing protein
MHPELTTTSIRVFDEAPSPIRWSVVKRTGLFCGAVAMLLGLAVLLGWAIDVPVLIRVTTEMAPMQRGAALGFLFTGFAFVGIGAGKPGFTFAGCALAASMAVASFFEYGLWGWGMSPVEAICFLVLAAGLVLSQIGPPEKGSTILGIASLLVAAVGAICGTSTLWGNGDVFGFGQLTSVAFHSAAGLLMLAVGAGVIALDTNLAVLQAPAWAPIGVGVVMMAIRLGLLQTFSPRHYNGLSATVAVLGAMLGAIAFGVFVHLALKTYLQRELLRASNLRLAQEMVDRNRAEEAAQAATGLLEQRVEERTEALEAVNEELRAEIARREGIEEDLRRQKEILQTIFDHAPVSINFLDETGRLRMANREWERLVGYTLDEANQGVDVIAEGYPDPKERQRALEFLASAASEWADFESQARDGRVQYSTWSVVRLSDGSKIGIGRDITERHHAELELRRQRDILQTIFDHIPVMINFGDANFEPQLANRQWEETLGWSIEEIRRDNVDILVHNYPDPEYRERVRDFVMNSNGQWADFKTKVRDGRVIDTSWLMLHLPDGTSIGIGQDITWRKRAEEALRESEERFRQLAENIKDLFWIKTPDLKRVIYMSPIYQRLTGRPPEEVYGDKDYRRYLDEIVPEDREKMAEIIRRGGGKEFDVEYRVVGRNGAVRWVQDRGFPIRDQSGTVYRMAGIATDITDRKLAENALRESEERFRQLTENIHEVFWLRSPDLTRLLYVSPLYEKVRGKPSEEIYSKGVDLEAVHPDDRGLVSKTMQNPTGEEFEIEYRMLTKDGDVRWLRDRGFPIRNREGQIYRMGGVAEDITERKEAENRLKATSEQLRALSASLQSAREAEATRIAHQIHDEMGGILTALRWELEALAKMIYEPGDLCPLKPAMENKLTAMLGLTDTTINVVRRIASELRPSILDDLGLAEAIEWQAQQFQARTEIECRCHFATPASRLDNPQSTAVFRIFQEALTNILRHSQATQVTVAMREETDSFILTVSDNGRGITETEKLSRNSLGILGMQERAHLMGGRVEIVGEKGVGTTLDVYIPIEEGPAGGTE